MTGKGLEAWLLALGRMDTGELWICERSDWGMTITNLCLLSHQDTPLLDAWPRSLTTTLPHAAAPPWHIKRSWPWYTPAVVGLARTGWEILEMDVYIITSKFRKETAEETWGLCCMRGVRIIASCPSSSRPGLWFMVEGNQVQHARVITWSGLGTFCLPLGLRRWSLICWLPRFHIRASEGRKWKAKTKKCGICISGKGSWWHLAHPGVIITGERKRCYERISPCE